MHEREPVNRVKCHASRRSCLGSDNLVVVIE